MIHRVLAHYNIGPVAAEEYLDGAGGFSGAEFWRLRLADDPLALSGGGPQLLCLRKWPPEHPRESQLRQMHAFLAALAERGLPVPAPLRTRNGETAVRQHQAWWELTPWLPGRADYHQAPSPVRLRAALQTLAHVHRASEDWQPHPPAPSAALRRRFEMLEGAADTVARIRAAEQHLPPSIGEVGDAILRRAPSLARRVWERYRDVRRLVLPSLWVVRDIWHDHMLFAGDEVTGIVDFGAIARDAASLDVARLLGSLAGANAADWSAGLAAYEQVRSLTPSEREATAAADQAAVVLSGLNWLTWLAVDRRRFPGREEEIRDRLAALHARIEKMN